MTEEEKIKAINNSIDPRCRGQVNTLEDAERYYSVLGPLRIILDLFQWKESPEGFIYWHNVYLRLEYGEGSL